MELNEKSRDELWNMLYQRLEKQLDDIAFLELNKDVLLSDSVRISKDIPLPMKSGYLIEGIKSNEYADCIKLDKIAISMMYVLGCTRNFKYGSEYIKILKSIGKGIDSYMLDLALKFAQKGKLMDALILFIALDGICDRHREIRYNIALTIKDLALSRESMLKKDQEKSKDEEYELYHKLSFIEFLRLKEDYPDFSHIDYHLGFYYLNEGENEKALTSWQKVMDSDVDDEIKCEVGRLIEVLKDNIDFEHGKECVLEGNMLGGLRKLIPLIEKYDTWSEAKYFTALAYRKLGNYKKAMMLLNELIESGEDFSEIYNELGLCCISLGDVKSAVKYLKRAVNAREYDVGYLCNLGIACYKAGDIKQAKEYIDKAYSISPEDEITKKCKKWADSIHQ